MKELEILIEFLFTNKQDTRIKFNKIIQSGHSIYFIEFTADISDKKIAGVSWNQYFPKSLKIKLDNKNNCIVLEGPDDTIDPIYIVDKHILDKFSLEVENHLNSRLTKDMGTIVNDVFSSCLNKDIYREWKMKKLFE
jgi:hypothetical protein